jgi:hypothetical protein
MMTDWLCRQGEHRKIELEETQTAVEMLRGSCRPPTRECRGLGLWSMHPAYLSVVPYCYIRAGADMPTSGGMKTHKF